MAILAEKKLAARVTAAPVHAIGKVVEAGDRGYAVRTDSGMLAPARAASCLLDPEPGDRVLVSGPDMSCTYIIAVLERTAEGRRLTFDGNTQLAVAGGSLKITVEDDLDLAAARQMALSADTFALKAAGGTILVERLRAFGRECTASIGAVRLVGNVLESFVDRLAQFAKSSLRKVEGLDQVKSGAVDMRADQTLSLQGRHVLTRAGELAKIDGEQIHLG